MQKNSFYRFLVFFVVFVSCNTATPEKYFDVAVLNCNMMMGFAGDGMLRQLEQPSEKLIVGTTDQTEPMKRKEIVDMKITFFEANLKKLKSLTPTEDTKDMLATSIRLNEYILAVFKNEYLQLAKLYDESGDRDALYALAKSIKDKHAHKFEEMFSQLTSIGKRYAEKHQIKVNWGV